MRFWLIFLIIFLPLYFFRLHSFQAENRAKIPHGSLVKIKGRINKPPYLKGSNQIISLQNFVLKTSRFPEFSYGQRIEAIGRVEIKVINSYKSDFLLNYPSIRLLTDENDLIDRGTSKNPLLGNDGIFLGFKKSVFDSRKKIEEIFSKFLPEPQANLMSGILLGSKKEMPQNFLKILQETGMIHVVAASGYNISVVAGFLISFLVLFMRRRAALVVAALGVIFYTIMAGSEPAILRAAIMGLGGYLAQFLGREKDVSISLAFAAALMLLISPLIPFDMGFQLSFLATAGIFYLTPVLKNKRIFKLPLVDENLAVTFGAQLATLPILLSNFGRVSFLSPFCNFLVLPVVPLAMALGGILALAGLIAGFLAGPVAWLCWLPLTYFVEVVGWFGHFPWASLEVANLSFWWGIGYYLVIATWILKNSKP